MPLLKQGHLEPAAQEHIQTASEYLQGWRIHNLPRQPVPVLDHPHSDKVFPHVQREPPMFQFVPIASGPVTGHHRAEPGSIYLAPLLQVLINTDEIPLSLLFSRLNSLSSFSLSSQESCSCPFVSLVARRWTLSSMSMSLLYWGAQNWTQDSRCGQC